MCTFFPDDLKLFSLIFKQIYHNFDSLQCDLAVLIGNIASAVFWQEMTEHLTTSLSALLG